MSVKKIVTARRTNQILCQEKWKKLRFWKNESQNRVGIFWQNPIFGAETFFQRTLENFLLACRTCLRYLKDPLNLVLCVSKKKIVTIRRTNQKILAKKKKETILFNFPWHDCSTWVQKRAISLPTIILKSKQNTDRNFCRKTFKIFLGCLDALLKVSPFRLFELFI